MSTQAAHIHEALRAFAVEARTHPPQMAKLSGTSAPMALNATYLVDDEREAEFRRLVAEQDERCPGLRLDLTGPWGRPAPSPIPRWWRDDGEPARRAGRSARPAARRRGGDRR